MDRIRCYSVGSMTISLETVQQHRQMERQIKSQQMFNMDGDQTILQNPLMDVDQLGQTIRPVESRDNLSL